MAAPVVAVLAGLAAEWLDFRALRVPLLTMVGLGVLGTSYAVTRGRPGMPEFLVTIGLGGLTWAGAESVYALVHVARGEMFHLDAGGPQAVQAVALIAAHGVILGLPTGLAVAILVHAIGLRRTAPR